MKTCECYDNDASPELLRELEKRRDKFKAKYEQLAQQCEDLRTILGLDNPEFLTFTTLAPTAQFLEKCDSDPAFCERYAADPAAGEAELRAEGSGKE